MTGTAPVRRDWLPTPSTSAPVGLPSPRVATAARADVLETSYAPFVVVLPSPRTALEPPGLSLPAPRVALDDLPAPVAVTAELDLPLEPVAPVEHVEPSASVVPARRSRLSRLVLGGLLNLAALLGLVMTGVTVYAATHDLHPLVVRSGSMEPLIHTGGMVLVQTIPASAIRVGDVVAAKRPDGVTVTHRVVSISRNGRLAQLVLKGDANKTNDPDPVPVAHVGRLVWSAPVLGRIAAWTASARGGFVLGCVVTAALLSLRRRSP